MLDAGVVKERIRALRREPVGVFSSGLAGYNRALDEALAVVEAMSDRDGVMSSGVACGPGTGVDALRERFVAEVAARGCRLRYGDEPGVTCLDALDSARAALHDDTQPEHGPLWGTMLGTDTRAWTERVADGLTACLGCRARALQERGELLPTPEPSPAGTGPEAPK